MLDSWLFSYKPSPHCSQRLLCFPFAGGGASMYKEWPDELPPTIELCAVQLPGRESRISEPAVPRVRDLLGPLAELVAALADAPYALFGHSMGALISFELAREIRRRDLPPPTHLFVSAHGAPQVGRRTRDRHALSDDELKRELLDLGGTPDVVLEHPELWQLLAPTLRADFALCETYEYTPEPPLGHPITALGGQHDPAVPVEDLDTWRTQTAAEFRRHVFPGHHFYVNDHRAEVTRVIAEALGSPGSSVRAD